MVLLASLVLFHAQAKAPADSFLTALKAAVASGNQSRVVSLFARPRDASYVLATSTGRAGLSAYKVAMLPSPPGWEESGPYWAVFHKMQDIEADHDPVYAVIQTGEGLRLGREIPENSISSFAIKEMGCDVHLLPAEHKATIAAWVDLDKTTGEKAPVFRINDYYVVNGATAKSTGPARVLTADTSVPSPKEGDVVRAGSLVVPWTKTPASRILFSYSAVMPQQWEDKVDAKVAYLTAWWAPTISRLPVKTNVRIVGPADWVLKSEGSEVDPAQAAGMGPVPALGTGEKAAAWHCDVPITFPKVVAGAYKVAGEAKVGEKTVRSYQLEPIDAARGDRQAKIMAAAMAWYEQNLAPFPFQDYACFDGLGYYGIESYSYTLLAPNIIDWAVSHEMGHTYFGGLAPCPYVRDSWNEGMTQYIDSIRYHNNGDHTLEQGFQTTNVNVPISQMPAPWAYNNCSYTRGAYAMKMLEAEIGPDKVMAALKEIVKDRVGKDTGWPQLRTYFEKAGGVPLDWFWSQWIEGATFPTIEAVDATRVVREGKPRTWVTVRQSGTPQPFRLKFLIRATHLTQQVEQLVTLTKSQGIFSLDSDFTPTEVSVVAFPYALAKVGKPISVGK